MSDSAYAAAGVDTSRAESAVAGLVAVLRTIDTGRESRAVLGSGHYANVLRIDERTGIALSTDGVGSKVIVAEQLGRFDTVGIDCIAMNVNDVICVGAEPLAVLDYIAVEDADPDMLRAIAEGLKRGAEDAGVEIPGRRARPAAGADPRAPIAAGLRPRRRLLRHGRSRRDRDGREHRAR